MKRHLMIFALGVLFVLTLNCAAFADLAQELTVRESAYHDTMMMNGIDPIHHQFLIQNGLTFSWIVGRDELEVNRPLEYVAHLRVCYAFGQVDPDFKICDVWFIDDPNIQPYKLRLRMGLGLDTVEIPIFPGMTLADLEKWVRDAQTRYLGVSREWSTAAILDSLIAILRQRGFII